MFLARAADGRRITSTRDEQGFCPQCNDDLVAKQGDIYDWHWSHRPGKSCDYRAGTTRWHYDWLSHYHWLGGWEVEYEDSGLSCDAVNHRQQQAVLLMVKLDIERATLFIEQAIESGYTPVIIFNSSCFKNLKKHNDRLKQSRKSDTTYTLFYRYANPKSRRKASMWVEVEHESNTWLGLDPGLHRLSHSDYYIHDIIVDPQARQRTKTIRPACSADARTD